MKMKKNVILLIVLGLTAVINKINAQNTNPFIVKQSGKGNKVLLFIPGFACSSEVWDETKSSYEKDFTCYTLTMPGFAGAPPESSPTFLGWEKEIVNYIQKNKINKPIIIGHSMGGALALAIAADYPDLI
jgi:pimeloyl-ACP methyl ester carboxylesterase